MFKLDLYLRKNECVRPVFPFLLLLCSHFSVVTNIVRHHPRGLSAFSPMPRKLLDISQDNRRILDCLSFLVEKKKRKKFLISTPFLSRFFHSGQFGIVSLK